MFRFAQEQTMITIISATNRIGSFTAGVAATYVEIAIKNNLPHRLVELTNFPSFPVDDSVYRKGENPFRSFAHDVFNTSEHILVVAPEYNGSFPGILKMLIDCADPEIYRGKKIALTGVASGRAGNLRGMDHLTGIFQYLKSHVYYNKLPISQIHSLVNESKIVSDQKTRDTMEFQLLGLNHF
jgi:chromate reductase, NAD(P)H dehydrogenase (quinone)